MTSFAKLSIMTSTVYSNSAPVQNIQILYVTLFHFIFMKTIYCNYNWFIKV